MNPRKKTPSEERKSLPDVIRRQLPLDSILLDKANPNRTNEDKEGILAASFASDASEGNQNKPEEGIRGMAEKAKGPNETVFGKERGPFDAIKVKPGGNWFAAMEVSSRFEKPVSEEDRNALKQAKKLVLVSDISSEKKKILFDYINLTESQIWERFSVTQAVGVVRAYINGKLPDAQFEFERRMMEAWCGGNIDRFLADEKAYINTLPIPDEEKKKINELIDLSLEKQPIVRVEFAMGLRIYHPLDEGVHPEAPFKDRKDMIVHLIGSLNSAKSIE